VCPTRLHLGVEHRLFVVEQDIVAHSAYLDEDGNTWDERWPTRTDLYESEALRFGAEVVAGLGSDRPRSLVLDVAKDAELGWVLLEANASWSSNPYGAAPSGVLSAVIAARAEGDEAWTWHADATQLERAERLPALRRSVPVWGARLGW
jgi:hypothetical protein